MPGPSSPPGHCAFPANCSTHQCSCLFKRWMKYEISASQSLRFLSQLLPQHQPLPALPSPGNVTTHLQLPMPAGRRENCPPLCPQATPWSQTCSRVGTQLFCCPQAPRFPHQTKPFGSGLMSSACLQRSHLLLPMGLKWCCCSKQVMITRRGEKTEAGHGAALCLLKQHSWINKFQEPESRDYPIFHTEVHKIICIKEDKEI